MPESGNKLSGAIGLFQPLGGPLTGRDPLDAGDQEWNAGLLRDALQTHRLLVESTHVLDWPSGAVKG
jgi:hypothetical protein